jgi:glycosyltransferase involved in cell wall biosynthesis
LQLYDQVIFYRVPAVPEVVRLIAQARALGKLVFYEIDDLLFDPIYPPPLHTYGSYVGPDQYRDLTRGMSLFRAAAQLCDYGIASTEPLARRLGQLVRTGQCYVHRNGLDRHNIFTAGPSAEDKGYLNIFYGSGTQAHNSDFTDLALPALERILAEHPQVRLVVVGYLKLPQAFSERFAQQLVKAPLVSNIKAYFVYLQAADINLAVLHRDAVNDCKSELKWFEAACFCIPSVLSRTQNYEDVIRDGEDGLLVETPEQWYQALKRLVQEPELRRRIGASAQARVLAHYNSRALACGLKNELGRFALKN